MMQKNSRQKRIRELLAMLSVEFVLGALLTTVVGYDSNKATVVQNVLLGLHGLLGVGIVVNAAMLVKRLYTDKQHNALSIAGLIAVLTAFAAGGYVSSRDNDWVVLVMALGFMVSLVCYGLLYVQTQKPAQ